MFWCVSLPALALAQGFERAYTLIWGSQISALQFLNSAGTVPVQFLRPWFDQAAAREPEVYKGYTFDQWLGFLQASALVLRSGENVGISLEGREFLRYLLQQGYTLYKRGCVTQQGSLRFPQSAREVAFGGLDDAP